VDELDGVTFEAAFSELEETVRRLEEGDLLLEESIVLFERGQLLAAYCTARLDNAELRVRQLMPAGENAAAEYTELTIVTNLSPAEQAGELGFGFRDE
jgi:exodeoxyribonuclease VII small subunit